MKISRSLLPLFLCAALALAQDAKQAATKSGPTVEITAEPMHHLKIDDRYVRAFYVEVPPYQSTLMHHHGYDYIAVALGNSEISTTTSEGAVRHIALEDGAVLYTPAPLTHFATDLAATPFRTAAI